MCLIEGVFVGKNEFCLYLLFRKAY